MLATEGAMPAGSAWAFEFAWDGLSAVAYLRPGGTRLLPGLDGRAVPAGLPPYFLDPDGPTVLHAGEQHGLAGVVAKRLDSRYQPGRRSRAWVETLPRHAQRVVIGGWQPSGRAGGERNGD